MSHRREANRKRSMSYGSLAGLDHKHESMITHPPTSPPASTQTQSSPPNPCTQQTRSTNTRNKLTQPVVLFYPIHPNSFPAEPTCFRVLFAPAEALAEGSKISLTGRQVPKPRCLSPAAHSLDVRIAGRQVPKPRCLSPAAHSLDVRIAGRRVPKPRCLSPAANSLYFRIAGGQPKDKH